MGDKSAIEWTEATWNPTTGCDRISPGCDHCYALTLAKRLKAMGQAKYQTDGKPPTSGPGFGLAVHPGSLGEPFRWKEPRRVVNSMSDLFHARVPAEFVLKVFTVMRATPQHTYQILTKRPDRMAQFARHLVWASPTAEKAAEGARGYQAYLGEPGSRPLPNVWCGTSIESDRYTWRADALRGAPAAVRFLSLEPLLGPLPSLDLTGIGWVIVGGESGPEHRPIEADWVRDLRDRCVERSVPFFFKQWGGRTPKAGGRELDGRKWSEYPR
jgi:protein gp37